MSDNWIAIVPEDPRYIPTERQRTRGRERFLEIAPDADKIEIRISDDIRFYDCGSNLEKTSCPSCPAEIPNEWWQDRLDDDSDDDGFKLAPYVMPCCNAQHTLHELDYDWPQGFGQFAIDAMNPNIEKLDVQCIAEFEEILGVPLRVIYQHR
jgi:hypothetical protein